MFGDLGANNRKTNLILFKFNEDATEMIIYLYPFYTPNFKALVECLTDSNK